MKNRGKSGNLYGTPVAVFLLGVISTGMLFWVYFLEEKQKTAFEHVDAVMDIQINTATFHLWFEEAVTEGGRDALAETFTYLEAAQKLSDAILYGGVSEHGAALASLRDPAHLKYAESIGADLIRLKEIAMKRYRDPRSAGVNSALDEQFDAVFADFQKRARALETMVEKGQASDQAYTKRLIFGAVAIWIIIAAGSIAGLYSRERRRRQAEAALEGAYAELEQRVKERTAELADTNARLRGEIAEKITLQAESLRAAHLASVGELAAGVAHEINNPINGIINYAQFLIDENKDGKAAPEVLGRIIKEGDRIATIVKSLLSFALERKEEKKPVRVHDILSETLALSAAQLRKDGIVLNVNLPEGLPRIFAHPQQIQQVFLNLINNARYALNQKYPGGNDGKILGILGDETTTADGHRQARLTFHDRGTGIAADKIDKVVDPFFTTKPRGAGTGLGLSISHGIISDHGGKLLIQSAEGQFTNVYILLPAMEVA